jgi:23S rRNA (guanine2445-N2)-methyltransferase / 23S rRNA (guanine2069-N7)-methyltransferase
VEIKQMHESLEFFVTCPKGIEGLLLDELNTLGADAAKETVAGVSIRGDLELG